MKNSRDDKTFSISPPKLITGFDHLCIPSTSSSSYNRNFVVDDSNDHQVSGWQLYNPGLWCIGKSIFWYDYLSQQKWRVLLNSITFSPKVPEMNLNGVQVKTTNNWKKTKLRPPQPQQSIQLSYIGFVKHDVCLSSYSTREFQNLGQIPLRANVFFRNKVVFESNTTYSPNTFLFRVDLEFGHQTPRKHLKLSLQKSCIKNISFQFLLVV